MKGYGEGAVSDNQDRMHRSASVTCMFVMQWLPPDTFNAVPGLARHMTVPREAHVHALTPPLKYITHTRHRGLVIAPRDTWSAGYKFKIHGRSDSDYAPNSDNHTRRSSGRVFVNDVPI